MDEIYIIRNQHGLYWGKAGEWVDGSDRRALLRARHRDEALNTLFELSARDLDLRGEVLAVAPDAKGLPAVEPTAGSAIKEQDQAAAVRPESAQDA
jgi:hypothetical protein